MLDARTGRSGDGKSRQRFLRVWDDELWYGSMKGFCTIAGQYYRYLDCGGLNCSGHVVAGLRKAGFPVPQQASPFLPSVRYLNVKVEAL